jgi:hypothetical protein
MTIKLPWHFGSNEYSNDSEYSWGPGQNPFPHDRPRLGGMYRGLHRMHRPKIRVSRDLRI